MPGKVIDLAGQTFGRLRVLGFRGVENHNAIWICACRCGKVCERQGGQLRSGNQKSCGCWGGKRRPYESAYNNLAYMAARRGVRITLTYEEFLTFVAITSCSYCAAPLLWKKYADQKTNRYNLDRKNNALGYSFDNCVACCYACNITKGDRFTHEEFMQLAPVLKDIRLRRS